MAPPYYVGDMENLLLSGERLNKINENLSLIEYTGGLTFGTDAYLLAAFVKGGHKKLVDLGSGTGVASLLCLAKNKTKTAYAAEIQERYASLIERNGRLNGFEDRLKVLCGDIRELTSTMTEGEADAVISNPPYFRNTDGFDCKTDEKSIARRELNGTIYDFAAAAARLLKFGGTFYTVYRPDRAAELIHALKENGLEPKRMLTVYPDTKSKPCLVLVESRKGGSPALIMDRPLFIYKDGTREHTADMEKIYEECAIWTK